MSKSKKLDPAEKARRAAERKRLSDERKAEKARLKLAAKAHKAALKTLSFFRMAGKGNDLARNVCAFFTPEQLETISRRRDRMTGPTEQAVALATGQEWKEEKDHDNDLPDGGEVKHIQSRDKNGKPVSTLGTFRGDIRCIERWNLVLLHLGGWIHGSDMPDEQKADLIARLSKGLTGKWYDELPVAVSDIITSYMKPSEALASYDKYIVLTTFTEWLKVFPDQYDDAFQLATVSNGDVKWRVRREWLHSLSPCNPPLEDVELEE